MRSKPLQYIGVLLGSILFLSLVNLVQASDEARSPKDEAITSNVAGKLKSDSLLRVSNLNVDTYKREVTLTGSVPSQADLDRASQLSRSVNGVKKVHNDLQIENLSFANTAGVGMGTNSDNDKTITSKVEDKLQTDSQLKGGMISVDTKDGEVTLKGMVNSQADVTRAAELAHYVDGVKRVDNRLKTEKSYSSSSSNNGLSNSTCIIGEPWGPSYC
jgi:hyperosmotically inducible periplasmic protein